MSSLSLSERILVTEFKEKHEWICYYCNKKILSKNELTVDHKTPLSRGGKTEENNLAISCIKCNRGKNNMTQIEYLLFKNKTSEILETLGLINKVNQLLTCYDSFIKEAQAINSEYYSNEKQIEVILEKILVQNFNAYQGYLLSKELKEAIKYKNYLEIKKDCYNTLHTLIGNNKKSLTETYMKIIDRIMKSQYIDIKKYFDVNGNYLSK